METVTLQALPRTDTGKGPSRRLRRDGRIPSVTYCRGTETVAVSVPRDALRAILRSERGRNTLIDLAVENGKTYPVMVKDFTVHPITRQLVHADFVQVDVNLPVTVEIPFRTVGRAIGEAAGGSLLQTVRNLKVRCLPAAVPAEVSHDVSAMEIDSVVRIRDLAIPEGVEVLHREDQKVLLVKPPRIEEVAKPEGAEEGAAEGAEGEAKKEGEEAAPAAEADKKADKK
jgi:large subunit ribosomal protein L25